MSLLLAGASTSLAAAGSSLSSAASRIACRVQGQRTQPDLACDLVTLSEAALSTGTATKLAQTQSSLDRALLEVKA